MSHHTSHVTHHISQMSQITGEQHWTVDTLCDTILEMSPPQNQNGPLIIHHRAHHTPHVTRHMSRNVTNHWKNSISSNTQTNYESFT